MGEGIISESDFNKLNLRAKSNAVWSHGEFIDTRSCYNYTVCLFAIKGHLNVEVWFDNRKNKIERIEPPENSEFLKLYGNAEKHIYPKTWEQYSKHIRRIEKIDKALKKLVIKGDEEASPLQKQLDKLTLLFGEIKKSAVAEHKSNDTLKLRNKGKSKDKIIKNFDDLFAHKNNADRSIQILRDVAPPVINENGHYILGSHSKGAITAWVHAHKQKGKIVTVTDKEIALLINEEIRGLNIDERTLRNTGTTAYKKYFTQILELI